MFKVVDSKEEEIYLKDVVSYPLSEGGVAAGYIIALLPSNMVEVQPEGEGLPLLMDGRYTTVTQSLIRDVRNLKSMEDFQALMKNAEHRFLIEKSKEKVKKKAAPRSKPARGCAEKTEEMEVEIDI